jgi:NADH-quinone oxidoreductase subunit F
MSKVTTRILDEGGRSDDAKNLKSIADNIAGRTICAFGEACAWPTQSFLAKFPEEFEARVEKTVP